MTPTPPPAATFPSQILDFMTEARHPAGAHRLNLAQSAPVSGTTVLFLHGVLRNWRTFFTLLGGLRGRFRLAALDFRGHGLSDRTPGAYRVADYPLTSPSKNGSRPVTFLSRVAPSAPWPRPRRASSR